MTKDTARLLLVNLLERMDADLSAFRGLVSAGEREALRVLTEVAAPTPIESIAAPPTADSVQSPAVRQTRGLDRTAATLQPQDDTVVFCLDFGTAKSKAFAARRTKNSEFEPIELGIGTLDDDVDRSVYMASSAIWIEDTGLVFVGSQAIRQSWRARRDAERARVDSLKQFVSQAISSDELRHETLNSKEDPTGSGMTQEDALLFYLGYLTDLASSELERLGHSRYCQRRFAMPCWKQDHRAWAAPYLSDLVARAQIVADTFRGGWTSGIPVKEVLEVVRQTATHANEVRYLLAADEKIDSVYSGRWGGVLEPVASASASTWANTNNRSLMLVVDVGAGTTDVGMFWINRTVDPIRAFPIKGTERAIRMAGDHVDEILLKELLDRGHVDPRLRSRAESAIRLSGLRRLKEQLFTSGSVQHTLLNDEVVTISLEHFSGLPAVRNFAESIREMILDVVEGLHVSWAKPAERIALVLTGGGSALPMIDGIASLDCSIGSGRARFVSAAASPAALADLLGAGLVPDYPKLAVAIGGCMDRADERMSLLEFAGAAPAPGRLERFQTQGL